MPVISFSPWRSRSLLREADVIYSSTSFFCSFEVNTDTSSCSGARTIKLTPKIVSGRVVNTSTTESFALPAPENRKEAPSERPTQFFCASLILSVQFNSSRAEIKRSAYAVIRIIHCRIRFRSTGWPPLSDRPSFTSSFANTVPSSGHQFTSESAK